MRAALTLLSVLLALAIVGVLVKRQWGAIGHPPVPTLPASATGDAEMAALHDRRSPETISDKQQAEAEDVRELFGAMFEDMFGTAPPPDIDSSDPDAMMRAAMEKMAAMAAEEDERRQAKAAARKTKRKPSAAQQQAEQAQQDADTLLRGIYRQLASALHPDRASDEAERQRKNALMGEANAAYERKDLVTLLNLQLQAELVDPDHLERLSDERLKSLTLLLKRQIGDLERERRPRRLRVVTRRQHISEPGGTPPHPLLAQPSTAGHQPCAVVAVCSRGTTAAFDGVPIHACSRSC